MKNIEKYKDIVLDNMNICDIDTFLRGICKKESREFCEGFNCQGCKERFLKWLLEEAKEPVLDDVEKSYLAGVIKPFRKQVLYISKIETRYKDDVCFIAIWLKGNDRFNLPDFNTNSGMYAGMQPFVKYSLEELGL